MTDVGFPILTFSADDSPKVRGTQHGEQFREAIHELVEIRSALMREKNATLSAATISRLAQEQWSMTSQYDGLLSDELEGIRRGANLSIEQLVILNNYTDFRDIQIDDQGCSMVYINDGNHSVGGQTWDMHGSAKNFVCCLEIADSTGQRLVVFSIVGCVGMMGYTSNGLMIGVNNINTIGARAGVMWPVVVRRMLQQPTVEDATTVLCAAPVTSGHNYLIADRDFGEMWEVMPDLSEKVLDSRTEAAGKIYHTNHCLGEQASQREQVITQNSTTYIRFDLLTKKIGAVSTLDNLYDLLNDHENYPQAICSNFQTNSQDPSITCGGAVGDLRTGQVRMWRGDPIYDDNFICHRFDLDVRNG